MEADNKENLAGFDRRSRVRTNEENGDQNKSIPGSLTAIQQGLVQPVDLTTDKSAAVTVERESNEDRWIKEPLSCRENSDEEEVFFGDVTNKEFQKHKKFSSRKTAVFVPGFRMDRRLMRYTMVPPTLASLNEKEESTQKEEQSFDIKHYEQIDNDGLKTLCLENSDNGKDRIANNTVENSLLDNDGYTTDEKILEINITHNDKAWDGVVSCNCLSDSVSKEGTHVSTGEVVQYANKNDSTEEIENLITDVINESICRATDKPDCSLLVPAVPDANGRSKGSDATSSSDDIREEEVNPQGILTNMMRMFNKRAAIQAMLARMRQQPENNPNTKGKPEAFEKMLQESEKKLSNVEILSDASQCKSEHIDAEEEKYDSLPKDQQSPDTVPNKECLELGSRFENLGIGTSNSVRQDLDEEIISYSPEDRSLVQTSTLRGSKDDSLPEDSKAHHTCKDNEDEQVSKQCPNPSLEVHQYSKSSTAAVLSGDECEAPFVYLNRNNSNSTESDLSFERVTDNIANLNLNSFPPTEILPNIPDDRAFEIDTIVARAADNEELAVTLPELDVDEIIDILTESSQHELFTPQREAVHGIVADGSLMLRRIDNTFVVASNNRVGSPSLVYPTLPEISTRIGATHTVTSVRGPISSPGAVRSEKRYRSIYATLPTDSIEIETQTIATKDIDADVLASFGKLDLKEAAHTQCSLDDPLENDTQGIVPVDSPCGSNHEDSEKENSFCSLKDKVQHFQAESPLLVQSTSSPLLDNSDIIPGDEIYVDPLSQSITLQHSSPDAMNYSASVVFTEKNFSPILEVHFPPSPPVVVPTGLKCTAHDSLLGKSTQCSTNFALRDMKRKQPSGEEISYIEESMCVQKNIPWTKSTKNKPPRTPPKKVIGQPNVHRFHAAFGKNPASRSLLHKFAIHVSPKTVCKTVPRTPGSNSKTRAKSPVSARKLILGKPPNTPTLSTPKPTNTNHKKTPGSSKVKTPNSAKSLSNLNSWVVPPCGKARNVHSAEKVKVSSSTANLGSTSKGTSKKASSQSLFKSSQVTPLFTKPSLLGRFHGTPLRQMTTPKTPQSHEKHYFELGRRPPRGNPKGTPLRVIDGEVSSSPMFPNSPSKITMRRGGSSSKKQMLHENSSQGCNRDITDGLQEDGNDVFENDDLSLMTDEGEKPPVFIKGTPRYQSEASEAGIGRSSDVYGEAPPKFDLDDLQDDSQNENGSRESSPRLSMEDILERKRQQMMNLRAEKRKIQDMISKQGSPTIKSPRANNSVTYDTPPKQRSGNTQTLALTEKELEAVTQLHTLCNSQRTVKVIHKGRAMLIRQVPQSPHTPRRLSWNDNLQVEIDENTEAEAKSPPSSPEASATPKPILTKKDARFVYPYDNESPPPVVVFRSRNGDRHRSSRSPRID